MKICKHQQPFTDEEGKFETYLCDKDWKECNYQCDKEQKDEGL